LDCRDGVRQWFNASGVHRAHLLDDVKKAVDGAEHALGLIAAQFQPRQVGDPVNISGVQGHVGSGGFATNLGAKTSSFKGAIRYYPVFGSGQMFWVPESAKKD
jgi:hypothetical protein